MESELFFLEPDSTKDL